MQNPIGDTQSGASLLDYAALVALIAVTAMIAVAWLGQESSDRMCQVGVALKEAQTLLTSESLSTAYLNRNHPEGAQCC